MPQARDSAVKVEAAGIEPASENDPSEILHACQVPIWSYPGLKEPASQPGHPPIRFRLLAAGSAAWDYPV
jgi:hypothetical protein